MAVTTTEATLALSAEPELREQRGLWTDAYRRLIRNKLAVAGITVLVTVLVVAFVGAWVGPTARYDPTDQDTTGASKQLGPSADHWFGTDQLGRDRFARVQEGVRTSIEIGFGTAFIVLSIGLIMGSLAAMGGKFSDSIVMRFTDIMFSFPDILAILLIRAVLIERDIPFVDQKVVIILAISMIAWTTIARLVRGQMLSLAERDYVLAARALGATRLSIVGKHMLPNTLGPVIVAITFGIPTAIFAEAALSFIGLGIAEPAVSLGGLVSSGYSTIQRNVWGVIFPAGAVAVLMLSFTFIGDGLRDALDPRTR
jgi:oligopeptide transport system permease protein